jgi:hypothetical protein
VTDGQLATLVGALIAFGGAIGAALRWSVGRVTKALDDNTASRDRGAEANVTLATAMAVLSTKIDAVSMYVHENTPVNQPIPSRTQTPRGTYLVGRGRTNTDGG